MQQLMLDPTFFAVPAGVTGIAYDHTGAVYDYACNPETCIQLANDGYTVRIPDTADTGHLSVDQLQAAVDAELAGAVDCFGDDHRK